MCLMAKEKKVTVDRYEHHEHEFPPLYDADCRILILGSFPSVKSRANQFYYGHPQNRFWKVLSGVLGCSLPATIEEKRQMLLKHHIAVWDVIESCDIIGSSDSSIRNVEPTDLPWIIRETGIVKIFVNGGTAAKMFEKYQKERLGMEAVRLPSTSPANAAWSVERLMTEWQAVRKALEAV